MKATKQAHDWHCNNHDTYGWRGEECKQCPAAPYDAISKLQVEIVTLKEKATQLEFRNERLVADYASVQEESKALRRIHAENLAIKDAEIAQLQDSSIDMLMALTDEQVTALTRLEGSNPDDAERIAKQAKEDWLSHDDWQYADRDACWKFFYSAGQSDGKAIPMKYRRMEFNAQLQAELAAAREEIAKLQANLRMARWERAEAELIEQLAVSQADNERLRGALTWARSGFNQASNGFQSQKHLEDHWILCNEALSTKPDNSALREHAAKLVERIAGEAPTPAIFEWIRRFADEIREGKF